MSLFNKYGNLNNLPMDHPLVVLENDIYNRLHGILKEYKPTIIEARALESLISQTISLTVGEYAIKTGMEMRKAEATKEN